MARAGRLIKLTMDPKLVARVEFMRDQKPEFSDWPLSKFVAWLAEQQLNKLEEKFMGEEENQDG